MDTLKISLGLEVFSGLLWGGRSYSPCGGGSSPWFSQQLQRSLKAEHTTHPRSSALHPPSLHPLPGQRSRTLNRLFLQSPSPPLSSSSRVSSRRRRVCLYCTRVEVRMDVGGKDSGALQANHQPHLLYSVVVRDGRSLTPSPMRTHSSGDIPLSLLYSTFPFHILLDQEMSLMQIGDGLRRRLGRCREGSKENCFQWALCYCFTWDTSQLPGYFNHAKHPVCATGETAWSEPCWQPWKGIFCFYCFSLCNKVALCPMYWNADANNGPPVTCETAYLGNFKTSSLLLS